jgi:hypothetical protein
MSQEVDTLVGEVALLSESESRAILGSLAAIDSEPSMTGGSVGLR